MAQLRVADVQESRQFQVLVELGHKDLAPFVNQYYWKQRSWVVMFHYAFSLLILGVWVWLGIQQAYGFEQWLASSGYAVLGFFAIVPIHELIHGLVYKLNGADDVRFNGSLRQGYVYAIAHHFVANARVFTWVAIAPFIVINLLLVLAALVFPAYAFHLICVLLLHTAGTSGDFAMLNYLWLHRERALFTFDDALEQKTYFYAAAEG